MLRSPSKFKIPTLDPSIEDTLGSCRVVHKHPQLIVREWKTHSNMRIACLQFQTEGAGKYIIIALKGSLSTNTTSFLLSHPSPLTSQTTFPSTNPWLPPSTSPVSNLSTLPQLPYPSRHSSSPNFTRLSETPTPSQSSLHPYPLPPSSPMNHHPANADHLTSIPLSTPSTLPSCSATIFTPYPLITPTPLSNENPSFSISTSALHRRQNLRHFQLLQYWPPYHNQWWPTPNHDSHPTPQMIRAPSAAPAISTLGLDHYAQTTRADIRFQANDILPPPLDPTANLETRTFHGVFLLPHADKSDYTIKTRDQIDIEVKFYAQGTYIGMFSALILHLQYIPYPRDGKKGDEWSLYSGSNEHGSTKKRAAFLVFEASMYSFPSETIWVSLLAFRDTGAPCFFHPFIDTFDADAILLYTILFPPGISPQLALLLGDRLKTSIHQHLLSGLPSHAADIKSLCENLFCLISPAISKTMGAFRLCIFTADDPSKDILRMIRQLPHHFSAWSEVPTLYGAIPTRETTIDIGGHLPSPTSLRDPDYLQSTMATYFMCGAHSLQLVLDHIKQDIHINVLRSQPPAAWATVLHYNTTRGKIHVLICQLPHGFSPTPTRARSTAITLPDNVSIPCIQVLLRPDIQYFFHLPTVTVGGFYNHMPLGVCTSPSAALLSHYLGRPPYEALYLLALHDCASVAANLITNPLVPPIPPPAPATPLIPDPHLPTPKRRGRPPAFQPDHHSSTAPPTSLHSSQSPFQSPVLSTSSSVSSETITRIEFQMSQVFTRLHNLEQQVQSLTTSTSTDTISSPMANIGKITLNSQNYYHNPLQSLTLHTRNSPPDRSEKQTPLLVPTQTKETKKWTTNSAVPSTSLCSVNVHLTLYQINSTKPLINCTPITSYLKSDLPTTTPFYFSPQPQQLIITSTLPPALPHNIPFVGSQTLTSGTCVKSTHSQLHNVQSRFPCQTIIIKFNATTMVTTPPNPHSTLAFLIEQFQEKYHPLPHNYTISYANKTICPSTPINFFKIISTPVLTINLPIRGGSPPLTQHNQQPSQRQYSKPKQRIISRQHFSLRIATINCNGAPKQSSSDNHKLLWEFISTQKIDVLYLIDHRSSLRSLEFLRQQGEKFLNQDIRLISSEITLLNKLPHNQGPDTSYHATVGGCAILTFGALAHVTFPSTFSDPSGANSFIGAKIQYCSSVPPLFLNAIYLFPPSQGPNTLATRIHNYLTSINSTLNSCEWQRSVIASLLQNQYDLHPNCAQIIGGDFNHSNWSSPSHPITHLFLSQLKFTNDVYNATSLDNSIQTPVTFPSASTWIDHFLTKGRVETNNYITHHDSLITTYTDHVPYSNDFTIFIPTQHYNIPGNMNIQAQAFMKSPHIKKDDKFTIDKFQSLCSTHKSKLCPDTSNWILPDYEHYYETTCSLLVQLAKQATHFKITTSTKSFTAWSPSISFLYKYIHFLMRLRNYHTNLSHNITPHHTNLLTQLQRFLSKYYNITKLIDGIPHYRYRDIIHKLYPKFPELNITLQLSTHSPSDIISEIIRNCKRLCHAKHQHELRSRINKITQQHEANRKTGKIKNIIKWILNKPTQNRFTTTVTTSNQIKALPKAAHEATLDHFTNHFQAHPWIHLSQLNAQTSQGEDLRTSLLEGTWRTNYPTLTHSLEPRFRAYASLYLDNFKYKATPSQQFDLQHLSNLPIPFSSFHQSLMHKNGQKSPGPSGLTISILQATPINVLENLHKALHEMWNHKHIPPSWKKREMCLLPKKPNSTTLAELRPLMLLEVLRKLWLSLIISPVSTYLLQNNLLCPYQCGGIPNSGTEDSILQLVNSLEDSSERAENLEILAFDKAKAFDSPGRIGGLALAWQRLGLPHSFAHYIAECDENNQIYPRTPHYLRSKYKHPSLAFHATMGTPQGCSSASISYVAVEDIILTTFQTNLSLIDPYLSRDPSGILFPQPPTQFVDDTYIFSRSITGAQTAIDLLQTAEPLLNIRINPAKTRHFSIHWSPPRHNSSPYFTMSPPTSTLSAYSSNGTMINIVPIPLSSPTRVLGAFLSPDNSSSITNELKPEISRLRYAIQKKKATLPTVWQILKQCIYPKFTYILKFTNLSMYDLNTISAGLRDLVRKKSHATHLPNALLFSANATSYSLPYYDLMSHTLREKERTTLRMLAGASFSRQIIHCLLERGHRLISEHHTMTNTPIGCPLLHHFTTQVDSTHYSWALSLIQYLQIAKSNVFTTTPTPLTLPHIHCTQTSLHSFYSHSLDTPLTLDDILDFESSYHIHFIEELFPYPPAPPHTFLPALNAIFPHQFHNFITRILTTIYTSHSTLTLGQVILREHMMISIPSIPNCTYIEGLIHNNNSHQSQHLLIRQWMSTKKHSNTTKLHLNHTPLTHATKHSFPLTSFISIRYIRSGIGYNPTSQFCTAIPLRQLIVPRRIPTFNELYAPPTIKCNLHPIIRTEWNSHRYSTSPAPVYTDGSLMQHPPLLTHLPINNITQIHSAIVFYNKQTEHLPWSQRTTIGIRIKFPITTSSSNYTAEVLGASIAAALPGKTNTHIYTDALGLVNSFYKTLTNNLNTVSVLNPHLKRDYTDTGILYNHLISNSSRLTLTHVKAHQEDHVHATKTEHGTGNRLADLVAQGKTEMAHQLCPNLKIFTYTLQDIIKPPNTPPIVFIGQNPTQPSFSIDHPSNTFQRYHTTILNEWLETTRPTSSLLSHLQWYDLTWNLAGLLISKHVTTNTTLKTFLFKVLYDTLPNKYTQHKYCRSPTTLSQRPLCPLCHQTNDSLSHTLCQCTHPRLQSLRMKTLTRLYHIPNHYPSGSPLIDVQRTLLNTITTCITNTEPDHRCLLGLLSQEALTNHQTVTETLKKAYLSILNITVPYISEVWKIYCNETHSVNTSNPLRPSPSHLTQHLPKLIVISGNNATLSTTTINDHQPPAYFRKTKKNTTLQAILLRHPKPRSTTTSHLHNLPSQSTKLHHPKNSLLLHSTLKQTSSSLQNTIQAQNHRT